MKNLVMVILLGTILVSCGGSAADMDVKSIDSACGCAEAATKIMGEQIEMAEKMVALGKDAAEEDMQKIMEAESPLRDKQKELQKHCKGDLSYRKAKKEDCEALKRLEDLKDEMKALQREFR
tara:strand:+ start:195 stop:560 length:366 start_codon:yes stop_codon:yes gene_type:complete